jgi:hypothetical protein
MTEFVWTFEDSNGIGRTGEVWNQEGRKFIPFKVPDFNFDLKKHNIDFLNIKVCQTHGCKSSDFYPRFFEYCPSCGANLIPVVASFTHPWASPYGNPDGSRSMPRLKWNLKELGKINELTKSSSFLPVVFQLPEGGGRFTFLITEGLKSLIALDRARDKTRVFSYSTASKRWVLHNASLPGFSGPPWAWSAATAKNGFAFPSDEGPCWVTLSVSGGEFIHNFTLKHNGKCKGIGGVAVWRDIALLPVECENNLAIAWRHCEPDAIWEIAPLVNQPAVEVKDAFLGAAALDGMDVFWSSKGGYLSAHIEKGMPQAKWHKWRENIDGYPQFMPYRDRYNVLWQLCFHMNSYCFNRLSHEGAEEQRKVDGPHFAVGNKSFCDDKVYDEPWHEESQDYYTGIGQEYFIQPLFELSNGLLYVVINKSIRIQSYIDPKNNDKYPSELAVRGKEVGDNRLLHGFSISSPWDGEAFLFNGGLYLYLENQNKCWFWPNTYEEIEVTD